MTIDEFFKTYNKKSIDYDGSCGVQCVDLIKLYCDKVYKIKLGTVGNAESYWNRFKNVYELFSNFKQIKNTPKFVPEKGDIMVWNKNHGRYGHVAICTGEGTTTYFYSYDQNWNGHKYVEKVKHEYKNVYGVLRYNKEEPKPEPKPKEFEAGNKVLVPIKFTGSESACNELVECETVAGARQFWVANEEFKKDYIEGTIAFVEGDSIGVAFHYYNFTNGIKTEFQIKVKKEGCK